MNEVSVWRARGYWALATVLLPLVNPPLVVYPVVFSDQEGFAPWVPVILLAVAANWALLRFVAGRLWRRPEMRRWRVATGVGLAFVLSFAYGFAELYALLVISCPESGCFD
jgi:cation transport ATPase